jgi:hypothetical protein
MEEKNIKTFKDLYLFLQNFNDNLFEWLETPWKGKDKQESIYRLFSYLNLLNKLNNYNVCKGNYNLQTIEKIKNMYDVFYNEKSKKIKLKDKGDSSDLTFINKNDNKNILVSTSKNINKENIGKLDIDKILTNFKQYENNYTLSLCLVIRDIKKFNKMIKKVEKTNHLLLEYVNKNDTILIDWNDLNEAFIQFKKIYKNKPFDDLINSVNKQTLILKIHQELTVYKTLKIKNNNIKEVLWGHIQRSGKSYIMAGNIIEDSKNKNKCNYLILTTAPNETILQYKNVLNCSQLNDFNIINLDGEYNKNTIEENENNVKDKNIIICSKQFLQSKINDNNKITKTDKINLIKKVLKENKIKTKRTYTEEEIEELQKKYDINFNNIDKNDKITEIKWLKNMNFEIRFIDESHNGGTTELSKKVLDFYGKKSFTVQITATYAKPSNDFNIPKENWILWDLEDIKLCKNIDIEKNKQILIDKHGEYFNKLLNNYTIETIKNEYSKYPDLFLLTDRLTDETTKDIIDKTKNNNYGWSCEACFLLKQNNNEKIEEFQNEKETLKMWYRIFGKYDKRNIPDDEYPDKNVFMKRIKNICNNPETKSRFIDDFEEPMVIMCFLPQNDINKISNTTKKLLEKYKVIPEYDIVIINSNISNEPKKIIDDSRIIAKNNNKKGILVLSGKQCSLGVSIKNCDIVILLNNNEGFDMIYQMMFRCMTEDKNKKCGFVIDLNIHRVIKMSIDYSQLIKPQEHPKDTLKYILQEKIINLNGDDWISSFGNNNDEINKITENIYNIYSSKAKEVIESFLNRFIFKELLLSKEQGIILKELFVNNDTTKQKNENKEQIENIKNEKIKKGIEKIIKDNKEEINNEAEKEDDKLNYMDIIKHIIPLICLLTIHNKDTSLNEMYEYVKDNKYVYILLINQIKSWWGDKADENKINLLLTIFNSNLNNDKEIKMIIRTVKELFMKNKYNKNELSKLIDKYLIPQELEKKNNAEVSTPYSLRKDMLDKMPLEFWTKENTVFEPCSGKGGFVIDIIDRFMNGLKDKYPEEKKRYKIIVEKLLYFSDINNTNIFICKLLIDPKNKYKLNYNEGNTLELNIKEKWGLDGFDAVIGNPPYNSSGNTGTGNTIWQLFTKKSLNEWLLNNGYLLYVHPPGWRKPNTIKGKFYGLFELMTQKNQIIYLSIHGIKDGKITFNCGTRYDWYLIEKKKKYKDTIIFDEEKKVSKYNLDKFKWLGNSNIDLIEKLISKNNNCNILCDFSYSRLDKKIVSKIKTDEFKYPLIYLTPSKGVRYIYSKVNNKGHFKIPKVIIGETGIENAINDYDGKYGMTQDSFGILINNKNEGDEILKVITSSKFINFIKKSCSWSNFRIDYRLFKDLKRDFWKEFI